MKKWYDYNFQSSPHTGADFKQFARDLRKELNRQLKQTDCRIVKYNVGHYYISGFIEKDGKFIYFNIGDVRFNLSGLGWEENILVRTARNIKDYTGGMNNRTTLHSFGKNVEKLLENN